MTKRTREQMVAGWYALLALCNAGPVVDKRGFRILHDAWAKEWARLSHADQGFCSEVISRRSRQPSAPCRERPQATVCT